MNSLHTQDTILLVEDNPRDILLIQRAFGKAGIINPLQVVNYGDAAVLYLSGEEPYSEHSGRHCPVIRSILPNL